MIYTPKRLVCCILLFILFVSSYMTVVDATATLRPVKFILSFRVESMRNATSATSFSIGDTLVVEANSTVACDCNVLVEANSSLAYEARSSVYSQVRMEIPLLSPAFKAGSTYTLSLNCFAPNTPLFGAFSLDSASYTFTVANVDTSIGLISVYDDVMNNLYAIANLTDVNGYPVIKEQVSFYVQFKSFDPLTDGWVPLGSRLTNENGTAKLSVGANNPFNNQLALKACHEGNVNFGPSKKTVDVKVISDLDERLTYMPRPIRNATQTGGAGISDTGTVTKSMDENSTFAYLSLNMTANYTSSTQLTGDFDVMIFWMDYINSSGYIYSPNLFLISGGPPYVYQTTLTWEPTTSGIHTLYAGVVSGNITQIARAIGNGTGVLAWGNWSLNIGPCPSNLVLHLPDATYGNTLPLEAVLCRARPSEASDDGVYATSSLATQLVYDNVSYSIDNPVNVSVPAILYVNGTMKATNMTDANGTVSFLYPLSFQGTNLNLNLNCTANCTGFPLQQVNATRTVTLTNVNVSDAALGGNGPFMVNYTVNGQVATAGLSNATIYVQAENQVDLTTSLSTSPVQGTPISFLVGKPIARACTNSSGWVPVPAGSTLLRVVSFYNNGTTTANLAYTDINHDGEVDIRDQSIVNKAYGSAPGIANNSTSWNWRADVNFDLKVDIRDISLVAKDFGKAVSYVNVSDCTAVNATFEMANGQLTSFSLDSSGCANVTFGALAVNFSLPSGRVATIIEFYNSSYHPQSSSTDDTGTISASWTPPALASLNSSDPAWPSYLALTWLPCFATVWNIQAVTSQWNGSTSISDPLSIATYMNVIKRPVSLTLTNSSYAPQTVVETPVENGYHPSGADYYDGSYFDLVIGYKQTDQYPIERSCRTYLRFDISNIPANSTILSARIKVYCFNASTLSESRTYTINLITQDWNPLTISGTYDASIVYPPTNSLSWNPNQTGWMVWDVTSDVQQWYAVPSSNYGHEIIDGGYGTSSDCYCSLLGGNSSGAVLEVTYIQNCYLPISLEADLVDGANGGPLSGVTVSFSGGCNPSSNLTNSSGVASTIWPGPSTTEEYNVTASYAGDSFHNSASDSLCLDFRTCTTISVSGLVNGQVIYMGTHENREFDCAVNPPISVSDPVQVSVNGSSYANLTLGFNEVPFFWNTSSPGLYLINITYGGDDAYQLSQFLLVPVVQVSPVCLSFNVTPSEFAPGDNVTLYAQAVDPLDGANLCGVKVQFWLNGSTLMNPQNNLTNGDGVFSMPWQYPSDGSICTVNASVIPDNTIGNCSLMVQPATLTVGNETQLLLSAWRDQQGTGHTIYAQLVDGSGNALKQGYNVTLTVNGTSYSQLTNQSGFVTLHLTLQPGDTSANTYQVMATFNGTNLRSFSINASDPYGDQYAVCTTNQYDLRPSTNSSTLAVLLQTTDAITAAKTTEDMQQEAQQSGWMPPAKPEFTLWYPWFRMHFQFAPNGNLAFDVGVSPLPFGNTVTYSSAFNIAVTNLLQKVLVGIASAIALSDVVGQIAALFGPEGFLAALLISTETKILSFAASFNSADGLISVFLGALVTTVIGYVKTLLLSGIEVFSKILECATDVSNLWDVGFGALYSMISIPMNIVFMIIVIQRAIQLGVNFL